MLKSDDELAVFCAVWSIAWSGFNFANILPEIYVQEAANKLVELWISEKTGKRLRRQAAWAICSICKPRLEFVDVPKLQASIEEKLIHPQNDYDDRAALFLGMLCQYWSREETQKHLESIKSNFVLDHVRFLEELGYKRKTKKVR